MTQKDAEFLRGRRYALSPTKEQIETFHQYAGVSRLIYNLALEQRHTFWRQYLRVNGKHISILSQSKELTALRAEYDFIRSVHSDVCGYALRDLDKAFRDYFRGKAAYPRYRSKHRGVSFRFKGAYVSTRKINAKWSEIRLPGIGWVKYRDTRPTSDHIQNATVSLTGATWFVSVVCRVSGKSPAPQVSVGIDRGVANTIALSSGQLASLPASMVKIEARQRHAQSALSRRKPGSNRHAKQRAKVASIYARATAIRLNWLHGQSANIAREHNLVALESLAIRNMTASGRRKRGLNRSILKQGWGIFARQLQYKLEERGGLLVFVNPAYSSQTCSACGAVDAENRKSQAVFRCVTCGHEGHADVEAAKEILRRSTAPKDVEGPRRRPVEASTKGAAA